MAGKRPRKPVPAVPYRDPLVGRVVARCRLEEYVDSGKSAAVYRGVHLGMERPVAVKILKPEAAAVLSVVDSFRKEARAIARLDSENVLKVYDVVDEGDLHCMVMELLDGESVFDLAARRGRLTQHDSLRIVRQAALGLKAAHAHGIVHRDVKPQNLVVLPDGTVKLVDFGLALEREGAKARVGTPHYVAPETAGTGHAEPASDVYALGITLFHLLVGQPPFAGMQVKDVLRAHLDTPDFDLEGRRPGVTRPVLELFESMTQRNLLLRPSAADVVATVDRIGGNKVIRKRGLAHRRSSVVAPLAGIALIVLLVGVLGYFLLRPGLDGDAEPGSTPRAGAHVEPVFVPDPIPVVTVDPAELAAKQALDERMEVEAEKLLSGAESWARANWKSRADTPAVVNRYRGLSGPHRRTEAAAEARRRVEAIEAGTLHPHPDRAWSTPEGIDAARRLWTEGQERLAELVAAHRYVEAQSLLPAVVSDPSGELEATLGFEHARLDALIEFPAALEARLAADPDRSRELETSQGKGRVREVHDDGFEMTIDGSEYSVDWTDVETIDVARLAIRAFEDAEVADLIPLLAFCSAHGLKDAFFQAAMTLDPSQGSAEDQAFVRALRASLVGR